MTTLCRQAMFAALVGLLITGAVPHAVAGPVNNIAPLAFGMTVEQASRALGTPLVYVFGKRGSEIFAADHPAETPGLHRVGTRVSLQFRNGRLAGWKNQWLLDRPTAF